jgi:hypothetical protein
MISVREKKRSNRVEISNFGTSLDSSLSSIIYEYVEMFSDISVKLHRMNEQGWKSMSWHARQTQNVDNFISNSNTYKQGRSHIRDTGKGNSNSQH